MNAKKSVSFMSMYDDSFNTNLANKQSVDWHMLFTVQKMSKDVLINRRGIKQCNGSKQTLYFYFL